MGVTFKNGGNVLNKGLAKCLANRRCSKDICFTTVNLKNSKHCFCNTTKRERLVGFLKRRKKGFRAEPWDQLQRWERKEAAENVKDRQQLKTLVPTDTSCCTQSFTNRRCCQI